MDGLKEILEAKDELNKNCKVKLTLGYWKRGENETFIECILPLAWNVDIENFPSCLTEFQARGEKGIEYFILVEYRNLYSIGDLVYRLFRNWGSGKRNDVHLYARDLSLEGLRVDLQKKEKKSFFERLKNRLA